MLIHFIGSKGSIATEIDYYRRIIAVVEKGGHALTNSWIEEAYKISSSDKNFDNLDWDSIYTENMESLAKTDLVIADVTAKSFAVGFQAAIALQQKKPTLLLQRESEANGHSSFYPASAKDNLLKHKVYNDDNLEQIIESFISENRIDNKDLRFNFFIDRQIYNYLRWASFKTGKTKAEILRELVQHEIEKQDQI